MGENNRVNVISSKVEISQVDLDNMILYALKNNEGVSEASLNKLIREQVNLRVDMLVWEILQDEDLIEKLKDAVIRVVNEHIKISLSVKP